MSRPDEESVPPSDDRPVATPGDAPGPQPGPDGIAPELPPRPPITRGRRLLGIVVGVLAIVAAALVIVWLPPSASVKAAAETTVLEYELAREAAWPKGATLGLPLSPADEHMLTVTLRTRVARYAAGDALAGYDADRVAAVFAADAAADRVHVVTRWKGEVVYLDFVRQAVPDGVIVRAGVHKARRRGRVDAVHQRVFARRWVWEDIVEVKDYTVREVDGAWKVVDVETWGTCDPDGTNVVEGREPM